MPTADETTETVATTEQAAITETVNGEQFDAARAMKTIAALRDELKALKPQAKRAAELEAEATKRKDAELSEVEKLNKRLAEAESELKQTRIATLRQQAAGKHKLPPEFADRLRGETPEELEADAAALAKLIPKPAAISTTNPGSTAGTGESEQQTRARIYGGGGGVFDPAAIAARGGGVFASNKKDG